jgi:hypothetical protein
MIEHNKKFDSSHTHDTLVFGKYESVIVNVHLKYEKLGVFLNEYDILGT